MMSEQHRLEHRPQAPECGRRTSILTDDDRTEHSGGHVPTDSLATCRYDVRATVCWFGAGHVDSQLESIAVAWPPVMVTPVIIARVDCCSGCFGCPYARIRVATQRHGMYCFLPGRRSITSRYVRSKAGCTWGGTRAVQHHRHVRTRDSDFRSTSAAGQTGGALRTCPFNVPREPEPRASRTSDADRVDGFATGYSEGSH